MQGVYEMNQGQKKSFKNALITYAVIIIVGLLPLIVTLLTAGIATLFGINLNEGSPPNIQLFGMALQFIGDILYAGGNMFWLTIITAPIAAIAFVAYTIYLVYKAIKFRQLQ